MDFQKTPNPETFTKRPTTPRETQSDGGTWVVGLLALLAIGAAIGVWLFSNSTAPPNGATTSESATSAPNATVKDLDAKAAAAEAALQELQSEVNAFEAKLQNQ